MKDILIATNSLDWPSIEGVVGYVRQSGHDPIVYESDLVFDQRKGLAAVLDPHEHGGLSVEYDGRTIRSETLGSAWYRRPNAISSGARDKIEQYHLIGEVALLHKGFWAIVPDERWLNAPSRTYDAENKLAQLVLAREIGLRIPRTVISNDWRRIEQELDPPIALKMPRGRLPNEKGESKIMYTHVLPTGSDLDNFAATCDPFPAIFQEYMPKAREWRVTVVGDEVFSASVYTDDEAKDDWRKWQGTDKVRYRREDIDASTAQKCVHLLRMLRLRYGACDLTEGPSGEVTFLEMNPSGQFKRFEVDTGLPISRAIGAELVRIAEG